MRYCLKYTNLCKNLSKADEIQIQYIEDRGLVDFMNKYANKRIVLLVDSKSFPDSEINKLIAIKKTYPDLQFTVCLNEYSEGLVEVLKKANLAFFIAILLVQFAVEEQNIAHAAVQIVADAVEGMEAHALGLAASQDGEVGRGDTHLGAELLGGHAPGFQHLFQTDFDGHGGSPPIK